MSKKYDTDIQEVLISMMVSEPELYTRCSSILKPSYFDKKLYKAAAFLMDYAEEYSGLPTIEMIKAETKTTIEQIKDINNSHKQWFMETILGFCKTKAIEHAIIKCSDLLEKGEDGNIEKIVKDATMVGLQTNMGLDYYADPRQRLEDLKSMNGDISSGWKSFDDIAYQIGRGELIIFTAISGGGKSVALQNITINFAEKGMNVIYITLELAEELVAKRLDSMITGIPNSEIFKKIDEVDITIKANKQKSGNITIKKMPSGTRPNEIKSYIREFIIQKGYKPDAIVVDYMDLINPNERRVDLSNMFVKDKLVAEALREIGSPQEFDLVVVSASQVNRSGYDNALGVGLNHMAGGISKANTADLVVNINNTSTLREQGMIQFQFIKTRNSGGVGRTLDMEYNVDTLKISDLPGGGDYGGFTSHSSSSGSNPKGPPTSASALMDKINKMNK